MIAITVAVLFVAAALLGMTAKRWNVQRSFAVLSSFPAMVCLASFMGLLHDSNSILFYESFVLGLLSSVLLTGVGIGLIVYRLKSRSPVRRQVLLTLVASCPMIYAVLKRAL
jgi:hypothetical protein